MQALHIDQELVLHFKRKAKDLVAKHSVEHDPSMHLCKLMNNYISFRVKSGTFGHQVNSNSDIV